MFRSSRQNLDMVGVLELFFLKTISFWYPVYIVMVVVNYEIILTFKKLIDPLKDIQGFGISQGEYYLLILGIYKSNIYNNSWGKEFIF